MSAFTLEAAHIERITTIHAETRVRTLTAYVNHPPLGETSGFPVSGDQLAILARGDTNAFVNRQLIIRDRILEGYLADD